MGVFVEIKKCFLFILVGCHTHEYAACLGFPCQIFTENARDVFVKLSAIICVVLHIIDFLLCMYVI